MLPGVVRWWLWRLRTPMAPDLYNCRHAHKIDAIDYEQLVERWLDDEPISHRPSFMRPLSKQEVIAGMSKRS